MSSRIAASNLPWVEKYRPESLDDLISQKEIVSTHIKVFQMFFKKGNISVIPLSFVENLRAGHTDPT